MGWGGPDAWHIPTPPHLKPQSQLLGSWQLSRLFVSGTPAPAPTSLSQSQTQFRARQSSSRLGRGGAPASSPGPHSAPPRAEPAAFGVSVLTSGELGGAEEQEGGSLEQEKHCSHPLQSGKKQTRGKEGAHPIITESEQRTVAPTQLLLSGPCPRGPYSMPLLDQHFVPTSPSPERQHGPFHGGPRAPCWPR